MNRVARALLPKRHFSTPVRIAGVVFIVGLACLARILLSSTLTGYSLELFFPAVLIAAVLFDHGAGLLATGLGSLCAAYFLPPAMTFQLDHVSVIALTVFALVGFLMTLIIEALRHALRELASAKEGKELLLKELVHRTRNDLFMVSSVIGLQARAHPDPVAKAALESAVARINAVGQVQRRLQTSGNNNGHVSLSVYLGGLCEELTELLRGVRPLALNLRAPQTQIDPSAAASVGLIVNELVTNALKYAFHDRSHGIVEVAVEHQGELTQIVVQDNGAGCPDDAPPGTGSRLVEQLVVRLGGEMRRKSTERGCRVEVTVPTLALLPAR